MTRYIAVIVVICVEATGHSVGQTHENRDIPKAVADHVSLPRETTPKLFRIPVGFDAYLLWDEWAEQRVGMRAYMRGTYDQSGGEMKVRMHPIFFINALASSMSRLMWKGRARWYSAVTTIGMEALGTLLWTVEIT